MKRFNPSFHLLIGLYGLGLASTSHLFLFLDADLDPDFTEKFLRFIINEVIRHHQQAKREQGA